MWESLNSLWSAVQSGVNLVYHAAGWLEGGLIASYEKFVMDCEVLQQIQRYFEPSPHRHLPGSPRRRRHRRRRPARPLLRRRPHAKPLHLSLLRPFPQRLAQLRGLAGSRLPHHRAARQPHLEGDPRRIRAAAHGRGHPRRARRLRRPPQARRRRPHGLLTRVGRQRPLRGKHPRGDKDMRATLLTGAAIGLCSPPEPPPPRPPPWPRRPPPRSSSPRRRPRSADWTQGWSGQATIYAWIPAINGSQEGPDGSAHRRPRQLGRPLGPRHGLHGLGAVPEGQVRHPARRRLRQARHRRHLGAGARRQPRPRPSSASTPPPSPTAFYEDPKGYVDVYGGARYFDTTIEFKLGTANLGAAPPSARAWTGPTPSSASAAA